MHIDSATKYDLGNLRFDGRMWCVNGSPYFIFDLELVDNLGLNLDTGFVVQEVVHAVCSQHPHRTHIVVLGKHGESWVILFRPQNFLRLF